MINYAYDEEKAVALLLAEKLNDRLAKDIIEKGHVSDREEAIHLSKFFWSMVNLSAKEDIKFPFEGGSQYWTEKLYNSIGGYLEKSGYEEEWNYEIDRA